MEYFMVIYIKIEIIDNIIQCIATNRYQDDIKNTLDIISWNFIKSDCF